VEVWRFLSSLLAVVVIGGRKKRGLLLLDLVLGGVWVCVRSHAHRKLLLLEFVSAGYVVPELSLAKGAAPCREVVLFPGCSSSL
jgi:hypothetical protein